MFKRLANLFRGFVGLFISGLEKQNPEALIELEKENLRTQIARFNDNLATHAGFVERLMRQIKNLETQERELTAKVSVHIKAGNRKIAGEIALQLQSAKTQLQENREQLVQGEETYKKLIKTRDITVQEAKQKIEKLKMMLSETKILEAQAELQEMASGMISEIGGTGDTLNRVEEYLDERRDKAAGRARVASSSIDMTEVTMKEAEQEALADQALAEFEIAHGFSSPITPESPTTEGPAKELGPKITE